MYIKGINHPGKERSMADAHDDIYPADHVLVDATRTGHVEAFGLLVERYHASILRYLTGQTSDRELAAELTQETFLDAFRDLNRLADDRPFAAWLYRIARNNLLHEQRRRRVRRLLSLDWLVSRGGPHPQALCRPDMTMHTDERDLVQNILASLSPALREALVLHSLIGFPSQEVAQILGISPAAALQRIARAKEQFRLHYNALNGVDNDTSM
jgi:RNA polymerase sigma factor (sigma-70 family)